MKRPPQRRRKDTGGVYVRKDSPYLWIYYYDRAGKRQLCSAGTTDKAEAYLQLRRIRNRIRINAPLPQGFGKKTPLYHGLVELLSEQERAKVKTYMTLKTDRGRIERFAAWCSEQGIQIIEAVDGDVIDAFSADLLRTGLQPSTVGRYVGCLTGLLPHKFKVKRFSGSRRIGKEIPQEILTKILTAAAPLFRAFLALLAETGLRTSHLCRAETAWMTKYKDGDETRYFLNFPPDASNKTKNAPLVPLSDSAMNIIGRLPCKGRYLFDKDGQPLFDKNRVGRRWQYLCGKLGISGYRVYDLRHTWAIREIMRTGDISYVSRVLGHSNPATTLKYYQNLSYARMIERVKGAHITDLDEALLDEIDVSSA